MRDYKVTITYKGSYWDIVEAENEEAAKKACWESWVNGADMFIDNSDFEYTVEEVW